MEIGERYNQIWLKNRKTTNLIDPLASLKKDSSRFFSKDLRRFSAVTDQR
jgi:hypothetical protein